MFNVEFIWFVISILGCETGNISLAIVYHGIANEDIRPYIFRLARQFYSPSKIIKMISYTVHGQIAKFYRLASRQLHPFLEHLNTVPFTEIESDDANMADTIVSIFGNDSLVQVIVIEDSMDQTWLPPTVFSDNPCVEHVYRVQMAGEMKRHTVQFVHDLNNVTLIKLDHWNRLSFNGAGLFAEMCKGIVIWFPPKVFGQFQQCAKYDYS